MGDPPVLRPAGQSNLVPVIVHPLIQPDGGGHRVAVRAGAVEAPPGVFSGVIDVSIDPPVGNRQEVSILLNAIGGSGESFSFPDDRRDGASAPAVSTDLDITFAGVPAGDYLARVVVSGAESPLDVQTASGPTLGAFTAPRLSVP